MRRAVAWMVVGAMACGLPERPPVMGTRSSAAGTRSLVYWRWKGDWRDKPREIGRLDRDPHGTLFGILGQADPEVVCRLGDACIVKRVTGWTTIDAPSEPLL